MTHEDFYSRMYRSSDSYLDIVQFYQEEMINDGWFEVNIDEHEDSQTGYLVWNGRYGENTPTSSATIYIFQLGNNEINIILSYTLQ